MRHMYFRLSQKKILPGKNIELYLISFYVIYMAFLIGPIPAFLSYYFWDKTQL